LSFRLAESRPWAERGFETALAQFELPLPRGAKIPLERPRSPLGLKTGLEGTRVRGGHFEYRFNDFYGAFESLSINGAETLMTGAPEFFPKLSVWRAPTDNDRNIKFRWAACGKGDNTDSENLDHVKTKVYSIKIEEGEGRARIAVSGSLGAPARAPLAKTELLYTILPTGEIQVEVSAKIREDLIFLPRFGYELALAEGSEYVEYFGLGPDENYPDMEAHVTMGHYRSTVSGEYFPYIKPQEHGNHGRVKWAAIYDALGRGILFKARGQVNFSASHYRAEDLAAAAHTADLRPRPETIARIDYKNGGIGSGSCGPYTREQYLVKDKEIRYAFAMLTFSTEELPPGELAGLMDAGD
jgi:beta-galactosidase